MSNAYDLAIPRSRIASVRNFPAGSRAHVQIPGGDCAAHMAYAGFDRRTRTATYALRFVNQTSCAMSARMFCVTRRGEAIPAYPLAIDIAPFSIKDTLVPVRIADVGPYDRALVEVQGGGIAFSVEAPAPPAPPSRSMRLVRWGAAAAVSTIVLAVAAAAATPRLPVLAAPSRALAGQRIDVPYVRAGLGSLQYELSTMDGRQIAAGIAGAREGVLHLTLPNSTFSTRYVLKARARGFLGEVERRAILLAMVPAVAVPRVVPPPAGAATRIQTLGVSPSPVRAGMPLKVTYESNAVAGDVRLTDLQGRSLARASLRPDGVTWLHVPLAAAGREVNVTVRASGPRGDATSSVGVVVFPPGEAAASSAGAAGVARAQGPASLTLSKETVPSGFAFAVRVSGSSGAVRVALTDAGGKVVSQRDAIPGATITMTAPHVRRATTYYVIATIVQGSGEQSLVRKIVVVPHVSRP